MSSATTDSVLRCPTTIAYENGGHHDCGLAMGHWPKDAHVCSECGLAWSGISLAPTK
jgi:hypothetical protein